MAGCVMRIMSDPPCGAGSDSLGGVAVDSLGGAGIGDVA